MENQKKKDMDSGPIKTDKPIKPKTNKLYLIKASDIDGAVVEKTWEGDSGATAYINISKRKLRYVLYKPRDEASYILVYDKDNLLIRKITQS